MLVPIKWLKEFVDIDISIEELKDRLVSAGFEIEGTEDLSSDIVNVVVGRIEAIEKHPNADKLSVCKLNIGSQILQIVTGAKNVKVGDYVPVALDNSSLPCGKKIYKGELRGVVSEGMLVGGEEFSMTDDDYPNASVDGILILEEGLSLGQDINIVFGRDDTVLDVGITANRTDANSIYGIAREVAAVLNKPLKPLKLEYKEEGQKAEDLISVDIKNATLCPRYMASVVKNVTIKQSPKIIRDRLRAVGIRPINNIVDITNYVLTEVGQPMHGFDIDKIAEGRIIVRNAKEGEKILALDDKEYTLTEQNLVIANKESVMAVAGVMGGKNHSIFEETNTIVFESARFERGSVRRTTKQIGLFSDSSLRFGKGVDFFSQKTGMKRALALIEEYGIGQIQRGIIDNFPNKQGEKTISFSEADIQKILGIGIPSNKILEILNSLELETTLKNEVFTTKIPLFREDMEGVNDIAEEIIRIYGYNHITPTLLKNCSMVKGGRTVLQKTLDKIKDVMVANGGFEILTYSFVSPKVFEYLHLPKESALRNAIRLINPLGEDFSVMRTTLAHSMIKTIATNYQRGNKDMLFFEVAKTYLKNADMTQYPIEKNTLVVGTLSDDFYSFKAVLEDLLSVLRIDASFSQHSIPYLQEGRCAKIIDKKACQFGYMGEVDKDVLKEYDIDKRVLIAELDAEYLVDRASGVLPFKTISKYPMIERDLALLAEKPLEAQTILNKVKSLNIDILRSVNIFDVYEGGQIEKGMKSVAIKLIFQSDEKTLKDSDVAEAIEKVLKELNTINVRLR